eukprot:Platyproteum_vivax@DN4559_c0_g1_i2.p1
MDAFFSNPLHILSAVSLSFVCATVAVLSIWIFPVLPRVQQIIIPTTYALMILVFVCLNFDMEFSKPGPKKPYFKSDFLNDFVGLDNHCKFLRCLSFGCLILMYQIGLCAYFIIGNDAVRGSSFQTFKRTFLIVELSISGSMLLFALIVFLYQCYRAIIVRRQTKSGNEQLEPASNLPLESIVFEFSAPGQPIPIFPSSQPERILQLQQEGKKRKKFRRSGEVFEVTKSEASTCTTLSSTASSPPSNSKKIAIMLKRAKNEDSSGWPQCPAEEAVAAPAVRKHNLLGEKVLDLREAAADTVRKCVFEDIQWESLDEDLPRKIAVSRECFYAMHPPKTTQLESSSMYMLTARTGADPITVQIYPGIPLQLDTVMLSEHVPPP